MMVSTMTSEKTIDYKNSHSCTFPAAFVVELFMKIHLNVAEFVNLDEKNFAIDDLADTIFRKKLATV